MLYGAFRGRNLEMTLAGSMLRTLLDGQTVPPLPRCAAIDPRSVAGSAEASFLHPGGPLTITGDGGGDVESKAVLVRIKPE